MNGTGILLHSIQNGILLGPTTFAGIEIDEVLSGRDDPAFEREWLQLFEQVKDTNLTEGETRDLNHLREAAFKAAFKHSSDPDLSGYISDDFEVIAKGAASNREDDFLTALLESYAAGTIPHHRIAGPRSSLRSLLESLRQHQ